jgi:RNA recognition motif-containing protein
VDPAKLAANAEPKKELFVGNVAFEASEADVQTFFSQYGEVESAKLMQRVSQISSL